MSTKILPRYPQNSEFNRWLERKLDRRERQHDGPQYFPKPVTDEEMQALMFAWKVVKHVKSNAIVYASAIETIGVGAGQMSRVDSSKIAVMKAQKPLKGSVLASDAFFPFRDAVDAAVEAGATAIIQPGGSVRDEESIKACNENNIAMVFTGIRCFRH